MQPLFGLVWFGLVRLSGKFYLPHYKWSPMGVTIYLWDEESLVALLLVLAEIWHWKLKLVRCLPVAAAIEWAVLPSSIISWKIWGHNKMFYHCSVSPCLFIKSLTLPYQSEQINDIRLVKIYTQLPTKSNTAPIWKLQF